MLREKVLNEWNRLKEIIKGGFDQPYQWGQLLSHLGIISLVPNLTLEEVVRVIKDKINYTYESRMNNLAQIDDYRILTQKIRTLKTDINRQIISPGEDYRDSYNWLKNKINDIILMDPDDYKPSDEDGPTIEEVD